MATLKDLTQSLREFGRNPEDYPDVDTYVQGLRFQKGVKSIYIQGEARGSKQYDINLAFSPIKIKIDPDEPDENMIRYKDPDSKTIYYFEPASFTQSKVRMRCSCMDYRHRFQHPNSKVKALLGPKKSYTRKTTTRPPVNPDDLPGYCKHIHNFIKRLTKEGYIVK